MFKKVLIVEDHEGTNVSMQKVVESLQIENVNFSHYCDEAFSKIKSGLENNEPYDLLITDLSFDEDEKPQNLKDGKALLKAVKKEQPTLKTIVFSAENKSGAIQSLFSEYGIDAFVKKSRTDSRELKKAIKLVYNGQSYIVPEVDHAIKKMNTYNLGLHDVHMITRLAEGVLLKDLPELFKEENITPNSLSSIEKRLNALKTSLGVKSNEHLIAFSKDLGVI